MPKHVSLIAQVISKGLKLDTKAWDKLYFGIRQDIKLGIRHGLAGGSVAGTFIEEDLDGSGSGTIQTINETGQPDKTRFRRSASSSRKYFTPRRFRPKCRCPRPGQYKRMSNRKYR